MNDTIPVNKALYNQLVADGYANESLQARVGELESESEERRKVIIAIAIRHHRRGEGNYKDILDKYMKQTDLLRTEASSIPVGAAGGFTVQQWVPPSEKWQHIAVVKEADGPVRYYENGMEVPQNQPETQAVRAKQVCPCAVEQHTNCKPCWSMSDTRPNKRSFDFQHARNCTTPGCFGTGTLSPVKETDNG